MAKPGVPTNPRPKRQHYVPRLLLKYFCTPSSKRVWVFDKWTNKIRQQAILEIAHENYYNEVPIGDGWFVSYEHKFQFIESEVAPVLAKINGGTPIRSLEAMEFALLCYFLAIQHLRTPAFLSANKQLNDIVRSLFPNNEIPETIQRQVGPMTDGAAKRDSLDLTFSLAEELCAALALKTWIVHEAQPNRSFYISDAPVTLYNYMKDEFRSTIGFRVPGIQIYLPISATNLIGAYCPMIARIAAEHSTPFRNAIESGCSLQCATPNMDFYNSLQVANSERFVYCRDNDFELAKNMIQEHPELRKRKRLERM